MLEDCGGSLLVGSDSPIVTSFRDLLESSRISNELVGHSRDPSRIERRSYSIGRLEKDRTWI